MAKREAADAVDRATLHALAKERTTKGQVFLKGRDIET